MEILEGITVCIKQLEWLYWTDDKRFDADFIPCFYAVKHVGDYYIKKDKETGVHYCTYSSYLTKSTFKGGNSLEITKERAQKHWEMTSATIVKDILL